MVSKFSIVIGALTLSLIGCGGKDSAAPPKNSRGHFKYEGKTYQIDNMHIERYTNNVKQMHISLLQEPAKKVDDLSKVRANWVLLYLNSDAETLTPGKYTFKKDSSDHFTVASGSFCPSWTWEPNGKSKNGDSKHLGSGSVTVNYKDNLCHIVLDGHLDNLQSVHAEYNGPFTTW